MNNSDSVIISPHRFTGAVRVPASKSHTIRQLLIASLADGFSQINYPLDSLDTRSCISVCRAFGVEITEHYAADPDELNPNPPSDNEEKLIRLEVKGNANFGNREQGRDVSNPVPVTVDVGNSGTTLYLALALAGLQDTPYQFTGDEQIQRRSAAPLLDALAGLGVQVRSNNGCAPITVSGPWKGGKVSLPCPTSQYLSALLISAPLAPSGTITEIEVPLLNEKPYVEMTLSYLKAHGIPFEASFASQGEEAPSRFVIYGGYSWRAKESSVPGDFSSAAFPAAAAAVTGGSVTLLGLDSNDTQGDKFFFEILRQMGCEVLWNNEALTPTVTVSRKGSLHGGTFDLNKTPDLLPAAAAVAAYADGDTALVNAAHARIKETDRIAVMAQELAKLGVACTERPDGLIVHGKGSLPPSALTPVIDGHGDHRIVMAFAVAALGSSVPVEITTAESAAVTYPEFLSLVKGYKKGSDLLPRS